MRSAELALSSGDRESTSIAPVALALDRKSFEPSSGAREFVSIRSQVRLSRSSIDLPVGDGPENSKRSNDGPRRAPRLSILRTGTFDAATLYFEVERIRIGRDPGAEVRLDGPDVSRIHAVIELQDGAWQLDDIESTNGTLVNGRRVRCQTLVTGDVISIGSWRLRLMCYRPAIAATAAPNENRISLRDEPAWENRPTLRVSG